MEEDIKGVLVVEAKDLPSQVGEVNQAKLLLD
jgi:hypothetical protein